MADFRVLGPVEVWCAERRFGPGTAKERAVLAALLNDVGTPIGVDTLIDRVWDAAPPAQARNALHVQLSRLRRLLARVTEIDGGSVALVRRSGGYALEIDPDQVDMHLMRRQIEQARSTRCDDERRACMLQAALGLWRGEPLTGVDGHWAELTRQLLHRERQDALELWAKAELQRGQAAESVGPLTALLR